MGNGFREAVAKWEKEHLSPYCLNKCKQVCCSSTGDIVMNAEQVKEAYKLNGSLMEHMPKLRAAGVSSIDGRRGFYYVPMHNGEAHPYCIAYIPETRKCRIQHNKPETCRVWPLFVDELVNKNFVTLSKDCELAEGLDDAIDSLILFCSEHNAFLTIGKEKVI